jgi:hypothetical protein
MDQGRMASMHALISRSYPSRRIAGWTKLATILLVGFGLAGCRAGVPATAVVPPTVTQEYIVTATASPTAEPERILLIIPDGKEDLLSRELRQAVGEIVTSHGEILDEANSITDQRLDAYRMVIMLYPDEAMVQSARQNPPIDFIAIAAVDFPSEPNLWVIGNRGSGMDRVAFLSGFVTAMITPEWRVGAIESTESRTGFQLDQAFIRGGTFFCGLCRPEHPPYYSYPVSLSLPDIGEASAQAALSAGADMSLRSIWVPETVLNLMDRIQLPQQMAFTGVFRPAALSDSQWIATIRPAPEERLREIWDLIASDAPAEQLEIPILVEDVNDSLLTPGKIRMLEQIRDELVRGFIDTGATEP